MRGGLGGCGVSLEMKFHKKCSCISKSRFLTTRNTKPRSILGHLVSFLKFQGGGVKFMKENRSNIGI